MLYQVAIQTDYLNLAHQKKTAQAKPAAPPSAGGPLWALDDTRPAGPYSHPVHESGLLLLCLSMIRQALMDERYFRNQELEDVREWLSDTAPTWLKVLGYWRSWKDPRVNPNSKNLIKQPYTRTQPTLFEDD